MNKRKKGNKYAHADKQWNWNKSQLVVAHASACAYVWWEATLPDVYTTRNTLIDPPVQPRTWEPFFSGFSQCTHSTIQHSTRSDKEKKKLCIFFFFLPSFFRVSLAHTVQRTDTHTRTIITGAIANSVLYGLYTTLTGCHLAPVSIGLLRLDTHAHTTNCAFVQ